MSRWMIYGAYGFTGRLAAERAKKLGMEPVLAGRDEARLKPLAEELGLEYRAFGLEDPGELRINTADLRVVLHCAGPFSATAMPMMENCISAGVHYVDITGEISVFEAAHAKHNAANRKDVVLLPGAGFDVVPTDCLAALLVEQLPSATDLVLAFEAGGGMSRGTALTSVEGLKSGGCVRRDGALEQVPLAYRTRTIPFPKGERECVTIPWGDVYTAHVSTGIPNIEVYMAMPPYQIKSLRRLRPLRKLLALPTFQRWLKARAEKTENPDAATRATTTAQVWGEVTSADGRRVVGTMSTPNGYVLTAVSSVAIVKRLLEEDFEGGYYTPSLLMGADFAGSLPRVSVRVPYEVEVPESDDAPAPEPGAAEPAPEARPEPEPEEPGGEADAADDAGDESGDETEPKP